MLRNCLVAVTSASWLGKGRRLYSNLASSAAVNATGGSAFIEAYVKRIPKGVYNYALRINPDRDNFQMLFERDFHPLTFTVQEIHRILKSIDPEFVNLTVDSRTPATSTVDENFDQLKFPKDHPGRSLSDTYYLNEDLLLRTHSSGLQLPTLKQVMDKKKLIDPVNYKNCAFTMVADAYRRDAIDSLHYPVFHQMEGFYHFSRETVRQRFLSSSTENQPPELIERIKNALSNPDQYFTSNFTQCNQEEHEVPESIAVMEHLRWTLEALVKQLFGSVLKRRGIPESQLKLRWQKENFPFTQPSMELEVEISALTGKGDEHWVEVLGCGVVKQSMLCPSEHGDSIAWAFGIGLERIAMMIFDIPDIRLLWTNDPRFILQFKEGGLGTRFKELSPYPALLRDISFWLSPSASEKYEENSLFDQIRSMLPADLLERVELIDLFEHKKSGRTSRCYRIHYRSHSQVISGEQVDSIHDNLLLNLSRSLYPGLSAPDIELRLPAGYKFKVNNN